MVEKKVYDGWAFSKDEEEKAKINREIYQDILNKYKVSTNRKDQDTPSFDIVLVRTPGYNHSTYSVVKDTTGLTQDEIALVCDSGNLCFGYTMEGKQFYVFED